MDVARKGNGVPGLFNDEPVIASLVRYGFPLKEAKDYGIVGCVEPSFPGRSFFSTDAADSLAALNKLVFEQKKYTLSEIVDALRVNFNGNPKMQAELSNAPKFGNDMDLPDQYANQVAKIYHDALASFKNTRGGNYVPGNYSSTCHVGFGRRTEALPSGRNRGEAFAASLGSANGHDRRGVTALLNSVAKVDATLAMNGYAINLRFDKNTIAGEKGLRVMTALTKGFFKSGGMEMQLNVLDPDMLEDAKNNPGKYPGIVVRVAGYCAYFDDLPNTVKEEIIDRTRLVPK